MTSISSITRQYSNKQKQTQKGGDGSGMFGFLKGNTTSDAAPSGDEPFGFRSNPFASGNSTGS